MSSSTVDASWHIPSASEASDTTTLAANTPRVSKLTKPDSAPAPYTAATVPPPSEERPRTLVLCFDGTGDQFDNDNSNIITLFSLLKKDDRTKQMAYYQAGIGTYTSSQVSTPFAATISKTLDEMIAWNLDTHVTAGYEFLMQNYTEGDRICIFGFSRGAYTARSLAGMVHKVGLLPPCNHQQVPFAYQMYTQADDEGWKQSTAFKRCFSTDVDIEFIGVWDTVNSVGLFDKTLPFTSSNTAVRTFRHAVSLDERRAKFKANLWNRPTAYEAQLGEDHHHHTGKQANHDDCEPDAAHKQRALEAKYNKPRGTPTDIDEVWFSGCHCDIGGGSVDNDTRHNLARIPLRWMIRECFKTNTGILFHADRLREIGLEPANLYPVVIPRPPHLPVGNLKISRIPPAKAPTAAPSSTAVDTTAAYPNGAETSEPIPDVLTEEEEELHDALSPIYDQLSLKWMWWPLELIPMQHKYQRSDTTWDTWFGWNLGGPRFIPKQKKGYKVHRSVKMRMEAEHEDRPGVKYKPHPAFTVDPIWAD